MPYENGEIAIAISIIASLAAFASALFTGKMVHNDNKRMRRKHPTMEIEVEGSQSQIAGWQTCYATIRNHEEVGLVVTGIQTSGRRAFVVSYGEASIGWNDFGEPRFPETLDPKKTTTIHRKVNPKGSLGSQSGVTPGDTVHIPLFTQGISKSTDLKLVWEWADGKKN